MKYQITAHMPWNASKHSTVCKGFNSLEKTIAEDIKLLMEWYHIIGYSI